MFEVDRTPSNIFFQATSKVGNIQEKTWLTVAAKMKGRKETGA